MLSCTGGAGYFLGDTEIADIFPFLTSEVHQVVKKKTVAKPKSFYAKRKADITGSKNQPLSFFLTLNDPSLNKIVGLNGEIIKKYDYSSVPVRKVQSRQKVHRETLVSVSTVSIKKASLKTAVPSIPVFKPKKFEVESQPKNSHQLNRNQKMSSEKPLRHNIASSGTRVVSKPALRKEAEAVKIIDQSLLGITSYVVQVSSFRQKQQAEALKVTLGKKGYAAFIGKIGLSGNKGTWYRVYIGRYFNHAGAEMAAAKFYREENRQAMVVQQSE